MIFDLASEFKKDLDSYTITRTFPDSPGNLKSDNEMDNVLAFLGSFSSPYVPEELTSVFKALFIVEAPLSITLDFFQIVRDNYKTHIHQGCYQAIETIVKSYCAPSGDLLN